MFRLFTIFGLLLTCLSVNCQPYHITLTSQQTEALGLLIWKNEGQQKLKNLTTWNHGENFPSLGLGHFIWYPNKEKGPFKEQFPALLNFFKENRVTPPLWLTQTKLAPWKSREQFYKAFNDPQLTQLRVFLSEHLDLQVKFIILRLQKAIPLILHDCNEEQKRKINANLRALSSTAQGLFTLLDYVNFKGEGVSKKERYQGHGWGLKQVLLTMPEHYTNALRAFSLAADEVLTRRVKNAPRDEFRWLKGWRSRIYSYQTINVQ